MLTRLTNAALVAAITSTLPITVSAQDWARSYDAAIARDITLRRIITLQFDQSPADIFPQLLTRVGLYDPTIIEVRFDHSQSENAGTFGVGSRRICVFADGRELVEPIVVYDPPHMYGYTVDHDASTMALPVSEIVLLYSFTAAEGGTDLTVHAHYDPRIAGTGPVIEPVLTGTLRRTFQSATTTFGGSYLNDEKP